MTLDDVRRLNIREAGSWPLLPKAVVLTLIFVVIVIVGGLLDWRDQLDTLDRVQGEELKLKEAYASKKAKAVNLELYIQQLREIEQSFGALLKQLPNNRLRQVEAPRGPLGAELRHRVCGPEREVAQYERGDARVTQGVRRHGSEHAAFVTRLNPPAVTP